MIAKIETVAMNATGRSEGQVIDLSIKVSKTYPSNLLTINFIQPQNPSDSV